MKELYWISVVGNIGTTLTVLGVIALAVGLILFIVAICCFNELANNIEYADKEEIEACGSFVKGYKWFIPIGFILLLASMFVPSKRDMYMIYGAGSVIEYIKSSDEAKQLPDNALKAINNWLEQAAPENRNEKNKP